jgi:hypothetical protein
MEQELVLKILKIANPEQKKNFQMNSKKDRYDDLIHYAS